MTTYTEDQLTGWITGVPPVRDGVYKIRDFGYFAYWSEEFGWGGGSYSPEDAVAEKANGAMRNTFHEYDSWRGMNHNPSAPPKPKSKGNKRKTMYVVMDYLEIDKPLGCFESEIVARNFATKFKSAIVEKVRFRTPEHN